MCRCARLNVARADRVFPDHRHLGKKGDTLVAELTDTEIAGPGLTTVPAVGEANANAVLIDRFSIPVRLRHERLGHSNRPLNGLSMKSGSAKSFAKPLVGEMIAGCGGWI